MNSPAFEGPIINNGYPLSFMRKRIYSVLNDKMPRRIKRLMFSASFFALMDRSHRHEKQSLLKHIKNVFFIDQKDKDIVSKINQELRLGKVSDNSLVFPIVVKSLIWKNLEKNPYFTFNHVQYDFRDIEKIKAVDHDLDYFTLFIISQMPIWLVYGSYSLIHHDIRQLIAVLS